MLDTTALSADVAAKLDSWNADWTAREALFSREERDRLEDARVAVGGEGRTVAYFVFENPFARGGGIFAVATHLPAALREAGENVVLISPFHRNLRTTPGYQDLGFLGDLHVPFQGRPVRVDLFEHYDKLGNRWVLFQGWGMFDADGGPSGANPYAHVVTWLTLRDGLFAAQALPLILEKLGLTRRVLVHAQDWQCSAAALTVKEAVLDGTLESAAVVLTSHNPYDHPLPDGNLSWISSRLGPTQWPLGRDTVYQRMIPLTDAPLSTVSEGFARELTDDPLQTEHFAKHLQRVFRVQSVVGVDNPLFGEPRSAFSDQATKEAAAGLPGAVLNEKVAKRRKLLEILDAYQDNRILGGLDGGIGRPLAELHDQTPIFLMFGRLDPGQKGFDLLARAIEGFERNEAKFILTPIVGDGQGPWVDDLAELARRRKGDVAVYPFRMEQGYMEAMGGATYAVMPSLYEPFGAATEAYLAGTPVIARATGGLTGQVADYRHDPAHATGFLFREKLPMGTLWPDIQRAPGPQERVRIPLYAMMAEALYDALQDGAKLWRDRRSAYGRVLSNLYPKAATFSRERAAAGYRAVYDVATGER